MNYDPTFRNRVRDYHRDPLFPTFLPLAVYYAARDHVRAAITARLNKSLFSGPHPRNLKLWERILLDLGF